jgi:1-deoxy-D-xylulose-5-phosphate synthase
VSVAVPDSPAALRALPAEALPGVCAALREAIVEACSRVGGHLGASLGAVELVVALHRVFKSPVDRLVFDVGHQAYAHKLLTGRAGNFGTLRQAGGVAPFLDPRESPHDAFAAGHACTAVSAALGILEAKRQLGQPGHAVAVVGDGALTGGLTFEGLANAGAASAPLVVVLNDNGMSISPNVGAVARMLARGGARGFFESLGFTYLGPVDGHALEALVDALGQARRSLKPVVVHVQTEKGRGFTAAEEDARTRGHAMGPFESRDGKWVRSRGGQPTFSDAAADAVGRMMEADARVVAVTPAMVEGSGLQGLVKRFPGRVHDVGIAEQHAVTYCAGLAQAGLRPVCFVYSTFLQRAVDQVAHDVCLTGLPVVFAVDRAGLVGADGATHQGAYDLAWLRPLPGMQLFAPSTGEDLWPMLEAAVASGGPAALRFPRGVLPPPNMAAQGPVTGFRVRQRVDGASLCLLAAGPLALCAEEAARGEPWDVLDAGRAWPLDDVAMARAAATGALLVVEEGTTHGGLGSAVLEWLSARGLAVRTRCLGLPDRFVPHGDARLQRAGLGLDAAGIRRAARELCP